MRQSNISQLSQLLRGSHSLKQPDHEAVGSGYDTLQPFPQARHHSQPSHVHDELLDHFLTRTISDFDLPQEMSSEDVMNLANGAPYLRLQMLAISVRHLSVLRPSQRDAHMEQAHTLQSAALFFYTSTVDEVAPTNCAALLLFSSLLAINRLTEVAFFRGHDTDMFLDRISIFIDSMRAARMIAHLSWRWLSQSKLGPILQAAQGPPQGYKDSAKECETLIPLVESAKMDEVDSGACREAIILLQWCFDAAGNSTRRTEHSGIAFAWPATMPEQFVHLLDLRKPEALVILAFYGRLLHRYRSIWFIGNAGEQVIERVTAYLGSEWESWLAWPNRCLASDPML